MQNTDEKVKKEYWTGKTVSYGFAFVILLTMFLRSQSYESKGQTLPFYEYCVGVFLVGNCIGVNIDATTIGKLFIK